MATACCKISISNRHALYAKNIEFRPLNLVVHTPVVQKLNLQRIVLASFLFNCKTYSSAVIMLLLHNILT